MYDNEFDKRRSKCKYFSFSYDPAADKYKYICCHPDNPPTRNIWGDCWRTKCPFTKEER